MRGVLVILASLLALPLLGSPLHAQSPVGTSLMVNLPPVSGGGARNLAFGSLAPGSTADTGPGSEANASTAKWQFTGLQKNAGYEMTFTLPATLTKGASVLTITWPANYGRWCSYRAADTCAGGTAFTPSAGSFVVNATTAAGPGNNDRVLDVWIGGQLAVPGDARAGLYAGTLSMTITGPGL
jgi:hypothetical protein